MIPFTPIPSGGTFETEEPRRQITATPACRNHRIRVNCLRSATGQQGTARTGNTARGLGNCTWNSHRRVTKPALGRRRRQLVRGDQFVPAPAPAAGQRRRCQPALARGTRAFFHLPFNISTEPDHAHTATGESSERGGQEALAPARSGQSTSVSARHDRGWSVVPRAYRDSSSTPGTQRRCMVLLSGSRKSGSRIDSYVSPLWTRRTSGDSNRIAFWTEFRATLRSSVLRFYAIGARLR